MILAKILSASKTLGVFFAMIIYMQQINVVTFWFGISQKCLAEHHGSQTGENPDTRVAMFVPTYQTKLIKLGDKVKISDANELEQMKYLVNFVSTG